ncbi:MAG TPA: hypothetical protein VJ787_10360 [Thermoleophilia bacterium]|nr:hypothetical protein [Thermoleophilia bacterium]
MRRRRLCVLDTTVASDVQSAALWQALVRLNLDVLVPDVVALTEFNKPELAQARRVGVGFESLTAYEEDTAACLAASYRRPSANDLAALAMAKHRGATLLTGDGPVRAAAGSENVATHGVLWLLDEMVDEAVITPERAASALQAMLDDGSRLPRDQCARRFAAWG